MSLAPALLALSIALASAGESPELDRVEKALEQAREDLGRETARADLARAEAARIVSAATARREAAAARLEAARLEKVRLSGREASLRAEIERRTPLVEAAEAELSGARDVARRLLADRAERGGAGREEAARLGGADDPELAPVARRLLELDAEEARAAERPALATGDVTVQGVGRVSGRVLRWGPGAWFVGENGLEAVRPLPAAGGAEVFERCEHEDLARAFAAVARGEGKVALPIPVRRESPPPGLGALVAKGGITMIPLLLLSVASVFTILERLLSRRSALSRVRALSLEPGSLAEDARSRLLVELRRRLWILGTVGSTAPFVGLFGTVVGIVRAFEDMARSGSAGFAVVAAGIAEALVATAAGIVVALIAVVAYNVLQAAATSAADELASEVAAASRARVS